jgi:MFS superfamily sulfate permease-like transporter
MLVEAIKQQRVSLACAVTVGIFLIFVFHAPVAPVAVGCLFSLVYLFVRRWTKLSSGKEQSS